MQDPFAAMDIPGGNVSDEDGNNLPFGLLDGPDDDPFSEEAPKKKQSKRKTSTLADADEYEKLLVEEARDNNSSKNELSSKK